MSESGYMHSAVSITHGWRSETRILLVHIFSQFLPARMRQPLQTVSRLFFAPIGQKKSSHGQLLDNPQFGLTSFGLTPFGLTPIGLTPFGLPQFRLMGHLDNPHLD